MLRRCLQGSSWAIGKGGSLSVCMVQCVVAPTAVTWLPTKLTAEQKEPIRRPTRSWSACLNR